MGTNSSVFKQSLPGGYEELITSTGFKKKEIRKWYNAFMKTCPDGIMQVKDFATVYCAKKLSTDEDPYLKELYTSHVFRTFDKNGDNTLDFEEFISGLSLINHGNKQDQLRWVFQMLDIDNSGTITKEELIELITSVQLIGTRTTSAHSNETLRVLYNLEAHRMLRQMDENEDGQITFEEFEKTASDDPVVLKLLQRL